MPRLSFGRQPRAAGRHDRDRLSRGVGHGEEATQLLDGRDRVEGTGHHLPGASPLRLVNQPGLEQLRVGEDDPELVVEAVEDLRQVRWWIGRVQW